MVHIVTTGLQNIIMILIILLRVVLVYRLVQSCVDVQAGAKLCWCTGWCRVVLVYRLVQSCVGVQAGAELYWCTGWCKIVLVYRLVQSFRRFGKLAVSFFLYTERAPGSLATLLPIYQSTRRHFPQDSRSSYSSP